VDLRLKLQTASKQTTILVRFIKASATYYGDTSILVAEARALRDGL